MILPSVIERMKEIAAEAEERGDEIHWWEENEYDEDDAFDHSDIEPEMEHDEDTGEFDVDIPGFLPTWETCLLSRSWSGSHDGNENEEEDVNSSEEEGNNNQGDSDEWETTDEE